MDLSGLRTRSGLVVTFGGRRYRVGIPKELSNKRSATVPVYHYVYLDGKPCLLRALLDEEEWDHDVSQFGQHSWVKDNGLLMVRDVGNLVLHMGRVTLQTDGTVRLGHCCMDGATGDIWAGGRAQAGRRPDISGPRIEKTRNQQRGFWLGVLSGLAAGAAAVGMMYLGVQQLQRALRPQSANSSWIVTVTPAKRGYLFGRASNPRRTARM